MAWAASSGREKEIASWISQGKSNPEIADLLSLSESTVKHHVGRMLNKTGCGNRAGLAAAMALRDQRALTGGERQRCECSCYLRR